jgi:hypothetical protein
MIDSDEVALGTLRLSLERAGALDRGRAEAVRRRARLGAARARVGGAERRIGSGAGRGHSVADETPAPWGRTRAVGEAVPERRTVGKGLMWKESSSGK